MLATSWKATGLVLPIWNRLDVEKDKRGELARLTGITATTLSGMNRGRIPMTPEAAARIAAAVPGVTSMDLGAPEEAASEEETLLLSDLRRRLARAEGQVDWLLDVVERLARVAKVKLPPLALPEDAQYEGASQ